MLSKIVILRICRLLTNNPRRQKWSKVNSTSTLLTAEELRWLVWWAPQGPRYRCLTCHQSQFSGIFIGNLQQTLSCQSINETFYWKTAVHQACHLNSNQLILEHLKRTVWIDVCPICPSFRRQRTENLSSATWLNLAKTEVSIWSAATGDLQQKSKLRLCLLLSNPKVDPIRIDGTKSFYWRDKLKIGEKLTNKSDESRNGMDLPTLIVKLLNRSCNVSLYEVFPRRWSSCQYWKSVELEMSLCPRPRSKASWIWSV